MKQLDELQDETNRYPTIEAGVTEFALAKAVGPVTIGSVVTPSYTSNSIVARAAAHRAEENN